ncbi:MAG: gamma-glutamyltransferase, partial [Pseudomonadota bacterium]
MRDFHTNGRSAVFATNGMCATSHPIGASVAVDILKQGGNAVDAAIAGALVLGICEPQMTGIGGDMFALIHPKPGADVMALNASGRAPMALGAERLRDQGKTGIGLGSVHSITVPGAIDGFCTLSQDYGQLPLDQVLAPTIHYATEGVPVAPRVAFDWAEAADRVQGSARDIYLQNGKAPETAAVFRAPGQAQVLRHIATHGRAGFYQGPVAQDMVDSLQSLGGLHTLDDFAQTKCTYHTPLSTTYHGVDMIEHPPNGQGATALLMLNMMQHFDWASMHPLGAERAHIEAQIAKLAYDTRNRLLSDMDYMTRLNHMLDQTTAAKLVGLIDPNRAMPNATTISEAIHKDTIYITVV